MTALDFELEISSGSDRTYPVAARSPGGEAATTMRLPLALADHAGRTRRVGADELSRLLAEQHTLRLVLNACDTGRGSAVDAFSSTAGALVRQWIPAVVAMQFEISDPAAIVFAQSCYEGVAKRRPVDSVMRAAARQQ